MTKQEIYVSVRTPEECKRAYEILSRAGEPIYSTTLRRLANNKIDIAQPFIDFDGQHWIGDNALYKRKTLITLDELEEMLGGKQEQCILKPEQQPEVNEAVEFADWILQRYIKMSLTIDEADKCWWYFRTAHGDKYTTSELYEIFKQHKK